MTTASVLTLTAQGQTLELTDDAFGAFRDSGDALGDAAELRRRLDEEGYLFIEGFLDRERVLETRAEVLGRLRANGHLHCNRPVGDAVAARDANPKWMPDLARGNAPLHRLLYEPAGPLMALQARLLGGPVRHFDHTWMRTIGPGTGTPPHCDSVYMNRGTDRLHTTWVPLGDVPMELGGLLLLEGSNRHDRLRRFYCRKDVDTYCQNHAKPGETPKRWSGPARDGWLTREPAKLRKAMGLRWLTADFRAGDVCIFPVQTVHGSLDNQTDRLRISCDARYQLACDPVDERWVGDKPIGHGPRASRAVIC